MQGGGSCSLKSHQPTADWTETMQLHKADAPYGQQNQPQQPQYLLTQQVLGINQVQHIALQQQLQWPQSATQQQQQQQQGLAYLQCLQQHQQQTLPWQHQQQVLMPANLSTAAPSYHSGHGAPSYR